MSGILYIISTPIGNLADLSTRACHALAQAEVVLAEDTRVSVKLLSHMHLRKPLKSCHDFNEEQRLPLLRDIAARNSTIALVSDAGTPLISDPGYKLVQEAINLGMKVEPIPGPSAFLLALVGSGLPCDRFVFDGFLPPKRKDRQQRIQALKAEKRTTVFYVSPHDLERVLKEMAEAVGNRQACLARELTKMHEEFIRGTIAQLLEHVTRCGVRGEYVLVVAGGALEGAGADEGLVRARVREMLQQGRRLKDISKLLAAETGLSAGKIYELGLECREAAEE